MAVQASIKGRGGDHSAFQNDHREAFQADVLAGLSGKQKTLPCKYLYDEAGSKLFEAICELEDYYLTRTEADIFHSNLDSMAALLGPSAVLVEPGAGNCEKAEPLLTAMDTPHAFYPLDISPEILLNAQQRIQARLPDLTVTPVVGDFTCAQPWGEIPPSSHRKVIFFPGSTIGNFSPDKASTLLAQFRSYLSTGDGLLIGVDLVKDSVVLERAYADSDHVTERFNKNLLSRINSELDGNFDTEAFAHRAFYHPHRQRVEMHLVSLCDQKVQVAGQTFDFEEGETIHTENSHKYTRAGLEALLRESGFNPTQFWTDNKQHYAIYYAETL
ncbi:L-histidine N(alpha)-methyltransferase [Microbulbifer salipaludis]|uniref:L-histidine N(Alpha)-methyltransferase n=1 Tax=Microbulbifer salipaludis TaxID=187980 RepID=A0ABS3E8N3_9GAMM|nr:L-histidine N(alpha)-methyltransferase [Microbulbifer salipaludis]MBN8431548.1 L-histidine N(alpha)-methyltransferase [Microbulbifer salipaludis]